MRFSKLGEIAEKRNSSGDSCRKGAGQKFSFKNKAESVLGFSALFQLNKNYFFISPSGRLKRKIVSFISRSADIDRSSQFGFRRLRLGAAEYIYPPGNQ